MGPDGLSTLGALAYLINSFPCFTYFPFPSRLSDLPYALPVFAIPLLLSLGASILIISLTDLIRREEKESLLCAHLLREAPDGGGEAPPRELDIPQLVRIAVGTGFWGKVAYIGLTLCCLLGLMVVGLLSLGGFADRLDGAYNTPTIVATGVVISVLNCLSYKDAEKAHLFMAVCQIASFVLSVNYTNEYWGNYLFVICFFTAWFMYQIPLPGILAAYNRSTTEQNRLQTVLFCPVFLACFAFKINQLAIKPFLDAIDSPYALGAILYVSRLATSHIYWSTFARCIVGWFYGRDVRGAQKNVRAIYVLAHWPAYVAYIVYRFTINTGNYDESEAREVLIIAFVILMPFISFRIHFILACSYEYKLASLIRRDDESLVSNRVSKCCVTIPMILMSVGLALSDAWAFVNELGENRFRIQSLIPNVIAAGVLLVLIAIRLIIR